MTKEDIFEGATELKWDEISAKAWRFYCSEVYKYHFRKMAKFNKQELIK